MKLIKDLLVFHIETTGPDPERDHIIQIAAVLLDKDSLLEKNFQNSFVKVSFLDGTIQKHSEQLGISFDELRQIIHLVSSHFLQQTPQQVCYSCVMLSKKAYNHLSMINTSSMFGRSVTFMPCISVSKKFHRLPL